MYATPGWYAAVLGLSAGVAGVLAMSLFQYRSRPAVPWLCWFLVGLVLLFSVVPVVVFLAALTNGSHHLFYTSVERVDDIDGWASALGPVNHLNRLYPYAMTLGSLGLLGWWSLTTPTGLSRPTAASGF